MYDHIQGRKHIADVTKVYLQSCFIRAPLLQCNQWIPKCTMQRVTTLNQFEHDTQLHRQEVTELLHGMFLVAALELPDCVSKTAKCIQW